MVSMLQSVLVLAYLSLASTQCLNGFYGSPGPICQKDCCSISEELELRDETELKFHRHLTRSIRELLSHDYTDELFYDLFYVDTPRYALPDYVIAAAKLGYFDDEELINYEIMRKMRFNSFTSDECRSIPFIERFIQSTKLSWEKSHLVYRSLLLGDEIKHFILSITIGETCIENVFKNGLFKEHSCNSCGASSGYFEDMRTCTSLCENTVNGCYYVLPRVLSDEYQYFTDALIKLLQNRADSESALQRQDIAVPLTDTDINDGVGCTGLPRSEVQYLLERLVRVPKQGREYSFSRAFRVLLRAPEYAVPEMIPLVPDAFSFCKNKQYQSGNNHCFNGVEKGSYQQETHPVTSLGQEQNEFRNFDGTSTEYSRLLEILAKMEELTDELYMHE